MQKMLSVEGPRTWLAASLALVSLGLPATARATVTEPPIMGTTTGESVPKPAYAGEVTVVMQRGFTAMDVTLPGLFNSRGDTIDYIKDAQTTPGTFSPQCGFTAQLILRGGSCQVGLGWYNATADATTPPPANQIYTLVPAPFPVCPMPPTALNPATACCADNDFCPLATYDTTQMPQHRWNMPIYSADNIRNDMRYKGGLIGFAMLGDTNLCKQNKYSQIEVNEKSPSGKPWVGAIVYQSTKEPSSYYLAFEDQPTSTKTWRGDNNPPNDGDFNDFVFYISGVTCKGGGKPCETGMKGVCANGVTQCSSGEDVMCKPIVTAGPEVCDGLDNDCDGVVDQSASCPQENYICDKGKCVGKCGTSEFPCAPGLECDNGYCKDPACIGVDCPVGQVCVGGTCQGGCDNGVKCPRGQSCVQGVCLDLCDGVTCMGGGVCENGVCVASCECQGCPTGQVCAANHHCVESGCEKQTCNPPATVCVAGSCKDNCEGVTCPSGQACQAGVCVRTASEGSGGFRGMIVEPGMGTGGPIFTGSGGRPGGVGTSGTGGAPGAAGSISTCTCTTAFGEGAEGPLAAGLVLALALCHRRRRRA
jgi:hypothetical protein